MNIGIISNTNQKGQLVIPKRIRDDLQILPQTPLNIITRGNIIFISPITTIFTNIKDEADYEDAYLKILKKTRGQWGKDDWSKQKEKRKNIEILASKERKKICSL